MMLRGKAARVTGTASGIGWAIAVVHACEGARVVVSDLDAQGGEALFVHLAR